MSVGKSSLVRASKGVATQKTIDKKAVLENVICEVEITSLSFTAKKADEKLVKSIEENGLICPITAVKDGEKLVVIDGAKRISAIKTLGNKTVQTVVVNGDSAKLKKELNSFKVKETVVEKKAEAPVQDIHEEKFNAISNISSALPVWML